MRNSGDLLSYVKTKGKHKKRARKRLREARKDIYDAKRNQVRVQSERQS